MTAIPMKRKMVRISHLTNASLIKLLFEGTYSCKELAELTGLHYVTVLEYMRALYRVGAVHISSWEKDIRGRDVVKVFKLGAATDAKRQRLTDVEKTRTWRQKRKAHQLNLVACGKGRFIKSANGKLRFEEIS